MGAAKHGRRGTRGWNKLHLGVDRSGVIVAHVLTEAAVDDATVGTDLIGAAAGDIASVTADAAYDTVAFFEAAGARHAQVVVPPTRTAKVSRRGPRSSARDPATRPSLAMAFALGVEVVGRPRRALPAAS